MAWATIATWIGWRQAICRPWLTAARLLASICPFHALPVASGWTAKVSDTWPEVIWVPLRMRSVPGRVAASRARSSRPWSWQTCRDRAAAQESPGLIPAKVPETDSSPRSDLAVICSTPIRPSCQASLPSASKRPILSGSAPSDEDASRSSSPVSVPWSEIRSKAAPAWQTSEEVSRPPRRVAGAKRVSRGLKMASGSPSVCSRISLSWAGDADGAGDPLDAG